jgi:hypothetical protein
MSRKEAPRIGLFNDKHGLHRFPSRNDQMPETGRYGAIAFRTLGSGTSISARAARQTLDKSTKGSREHLRSPSFLWLRGPATTCRQTGRWRSGSRSPPETLVSSLTGRPLISTPLQGVRNITPVWDTRTPGAVSVIDEPAVTLLEAGILAALDQFWRYPSTGRHYRSHEDGLVKARLIRARRILSSRWSRRPGPGAGTSRPPRLGGLRGGRRLTRGRRRVGGRRLTRGSLPARGRRRVGGRR